MKKNTSKTLSLLLCISLLFTMAACSGEKEAMSADAAVSKADNATLQESTGSKSASEATPPDSTLYGDSLIGESFHAEETYTDKDGNEWAYAYHIPKLLSDASGAAKINAHIAEHVEKPMQINLDAIKEKLNPGILRIAWESHWNGSLLSMIIRQKSIFDTEEFLVYNYDFETDKWLTNQEVLEYCGVSQTLAKDVLRRTAAQAFDLQYKDLDVESWYMNAVPEQRWWTLSDENMDKNTLLYVGENKKLQAFYAVGSVAGSDWYHQTLKLNLENPYGKDISATSDLVNAAVKDGVLTISIAESDTAQMELGVSGEEYVVNGAFGRYTAIHIGNVGNGYAPYVFLLTETGQVEFVNVLECLDAGYFCVSGPMPNVTDIQSLEDGVVGNEDEPGYITVFGVGRDGKTELDVWTMEHRISNRLTYESWSSDTITHPVDGGDSFDGRYILQFLEDGTFALTDVTEAVGISIEQTGNWLYLGMTEAGIVLKYMLYTETDDYLKGALLLQAKGGDLQLKLLAGSRLFDVPNGEEIHFGQSYG